MKSTAASETAAPSGNLALIHQEALTSIVRLRSGRQSVTDAQYFRTQFREALKLAHEEARNRGYSDDEIRDARFATVAFLDESILNLRNPVFADWVRKPLQEELFGVHVGGEVFFKDVDRLMGQVDSPSLADVLEVYLLCVLLGYAGRYSAAGKGELNAVRDSMMAKIRRIRGPSPELSASWRPEAGAAGGGRADPWVRRLLIIAACCFIGILVLYSGFHLALNAGASEVHAIAGSRGGS
ncbi:MAG: DotU family type IV/VI secretion system protein [Hyphomicrobiales bacterium]|nr:MAG: DotU family type IV/VI secretion system protein [Hyphomicrobiales bacterium]